MVRLIQYLQTACCESTNFSCMDTPFLSLRLTLLTRIYPKELIHGWRRPRVRPHNSWLKQADDSCWEALGVGRMFAWRLTRRNHKTWRHKLCAVKSSFLYASPHDAAHRDVKGAQAAKNVLLVYNS